MLVAAGSYQPRHSTVPSEALRTLVLLLYATGLRVGEALALRLRDVDLPEALLTVRRAKFHKMRLVPMGADLVRELEAYRSARCAAFPSQDDEAAFLADSQGGHLRYKNVGHAFRQVRAAAGVLRTDEPATSLASTTCAPASPPNDSPSGTGGEGMCSGCCRCCPPI